MSDIQIKVDGQEFIDGLNLNEKKLLLQILTEDLTEDGEIDKEIDPEWLKRHRHSVEGEVYVDLDDIMWSMSTWDKKEMYEELHSEYGEESHDSLDGFLAAESDTYQAQELAAAFIELWRTRNLLTKSQVERIQAITREPYVD